MAAVITNGPLSVYIPKLPRDSNGAPIEGRSISLHEPQARWDACDGEERQTGEDREGAMPDTQAQDHMT